MSNSCQLRKPTKFKVEEVIVLSDIWHVRGVMPSRRFKKTLYLRVLPDKRWQSVNSIVLPAGWIAIIEATVRPIGNNGYPLGTGELYISKLPDIFVPNTQPDLYASLSDSRDKYVSEVISEAQPWQFKHFCTVNNHRDS